MSQTQKKAEQGAADPNRKTQLPQALATILQNQATKPGQVIRPEHFPSLGALAAALTPADMDDLQAVVADAGDAAKAFSAKVLTHLESIFYRHIPEWLMPSGSGDSGQG
jgi:hemoglobin-like flavoprotein